MTDTGQLSMPLTEEYRIGQRVLSGMKEEGRCHIPLEELTGGGYDDE